MKVDNDYVFGFGKVLVSVAKNISTKTPMLLLSKLKEQQKVGEDLLNKDAETSETTAIIFNNLESLAVLEKALKEVKKLIKQQNYDSTN